MSGKESHTCHPGIKYQLTYPKAKVFFLIDGSKAAGATYDNTVRVVETGTGKLTHTLSGHTGRILAIVFSPDGSQVLTGSIDSTAILWDLR